MMLFPRRKLSFPQAALGIRVEVETVEGQVKLKIPSGTQPETVIRLRGKGVSMSGVRETATIMSVLK